MLPRPPSPLLPPLHAPALLHSCALHAQDVDVPASVFHIEVPDMFYRARVLRPDDSHTGCVVVKLLEEEGDKARCGRGPRLRVSVHVCMWVGYVCNPAWVRACGLVCSRKQAACVSHEQARSTLLRSSARGLHRCIGQEPPSRT